MWGHDIYHCKCAGAQASVSECDKKCTGAWAEEHLHTDEATGFVQLQGFRWRAYFKK